MTNGYVIGDINEELSPCLLKIANGQNMIIRSDSDWLFNTHP